jgi:hypothetical protein
MTELNRTPGIDPEGGDAQVKWPALPADGARAAGNVSSGDPAVAALLGRLGNLPDLPVAQHGEVYALLHDELLAALNESSVGQAATGQPATEQPATGPASAGPTNPPGDAKNEQA